MNKLKLGIVLLAFIAMTGVANAGGVGYIDYLKVIDNYDYAKKVTKEVDAKGLEMQQYLVDKEKELDRLAKEREKLISEIKRVEGKLNNQGFVAKAPKEVVEAEAAKGKTYKEMLEKVEEAIKVLN